MAAQRKLDAPITLFAAIEADQHEALRRIAFDEHRSIADVAREAIGEYLTKRIGKAGKARPASGRTRTSSHTTATTR